LASCVVPLVSSSAICEAFGWERGVDRSWREAPAFRGIYTTMIVVAVVVTLIPNVSLITIMLVAQFVSGIMLPVLLVFMVGIASDRHVMGRYANRIANSRFPLGGAVVELTANEGPNHLHGVLTRCLYEVEQGENSLTLRRTSPAGEEGYPGRLDIAVTYTLREDNALVMDYKVKSDADTVLNLTNHSYFNLAGHNSGGVEEQRLQLSASRFTPIGEGSIPTGELAGVEGTPFDFRTEKPIGQDIGADDAQLRQGGGYDHNFVLDAPGLERPFAVARSEKTLITMECFTTQPGVQLYTANFVQDDTARGMGKEGAEYGHRSAFCLETQHFPDSPNRPDFPSTLLKAGEEYHEVTVYRFSVRK
jgi:aldose 1-epimerase